MSLSFNCGEITEEKYRSIALSLCGELKNFKFPSEKSYQLKYLTSGGSGHIFTIETEDNHDSYCIKVLKRDRAKHHGNVNTFINEAKISFALGEPIKVKDKDKDIEHPPIGIKCIPTKEGKSHSSLTIDDLSLPFFVSQRGLNLARLLKPISPTESNGWDSEFHQSYWRRFSNKGDVADQIRTMMQSLDLSLFHLHCPYWDFSQQEKEPAFHLDIKAENICVVYEKVYEEEGIYRYFFMDFGSIVTKSGWTKLNQFHTTYDTLPELIKNTIDIREATSDKRVPVKTSSVNALSITPDQIDHHQLGRVFIDILESKTSYARIRNKLSAYESNKIYEIASCLLWSDDIKDNAKISPRDNTNRVSHLYEKIAHSSSNLHALFGPGFLPIPGTSLYKFDDRIKELTKTRVFRKLRGIKQLGLSCLVYPGATHTRFEHSLGTFQVAHDYIRSLISRTGSIWLTLRISPIDIKMCLLHALFHDLGHYPFAHYLEDTGIFPRHKDIMKWILTDDRKKLGIDCPGDGSCPSPNTHTKDTPCPARIANKEDLDELHEKLDELYRVTPNNWKEWFENIERSKSRPRKAIEGLYYGLSQIIDGPIDADAFDYVRRDSAHCGFSSIGTIERELFLSNLSFYSRPTSESQIESYVIGLREEAHCVIEQINLARYHLYSLVYWNSKCRCYTALIRDAVCKCYDAQLGDSWASIGKWCREGTDESAVAILKNEWSNKEPSVITLVNDIENAVDYQIICEVQLKKPAFNAMMVKAEVPKGKNGSRLPEWTGKDVQFYPGGVLLKNEVTEVIKKELGEKKSDLTVVIDVPLQRFANKQKTQPAIIDEYGMAKPPGHIWNAINPALNEWPMKIRVLLQIKNLDDRIDDVKRKQIQSKIEQTFC